MSAKEKARGELSKKLVAHQFAIIRDILEYSNEFASPDPEEIPEYAFISAYDLLGQFVYNILGMMHERVRAVCDEKLGKTTIVSGLTGKAKN